MRKDSIKSSVKTLVTGTLHFLCSFLSPNGWLDRRIRWMSGDSLPIQSIPLKRDNGETVRLLNARSVDNTTSYVYSRRFDRFSVSRTFFTNPDRYEKEYYERIYQIHTRLEQTGVPVRTDEDGPDGNPFLFRVLVTMSPKDATKGNVQKVMGVLDEISAEDHHLYVYVKFDTEEWYVEAFRYSVSRAAVVLDATPSAQHNKLEVMKSLYEMNGNDSIKAVRFLSKESFDKAYDGMMGPGIVEIPADKDDGQTGASEP